VPPRGSVRAGGIVGFDDGGAELDVGVAGGVVVGTLLVVLGGGVAEDVVLGGVDGGVDAGGVPDDAEVHAVSARAARTAALSIGRRRTVTRLRSRTGRAASARR
jgi:hypothetical protein